MIAWFSILIFFLDHFINIRKWRSEYHSNFKPPSLFSYEDGVWKGANPPHIQPQDSSSEPDRQNKLRHAKSEGDIPSWFAEVSQRFIQWKVFNYNFFFLNLNCFVLELNLGILQWNVKSVPKVNATNIPLNSVCGGKSMRTVNPEYT